MYGDKTKRPLVIGGITILTIVIVMGSIYILHNSREWNNVWGMNGSYIIYENDTDNPRRVQRCVFDKMQYQDYRFLFSVAQTKGTCDIRLLDEKEICIKEWKNISTDFEEILENNIVDVLDAVEVISRGDTVDDDVVYRIDIDGRKNFWKRIKQDGM